MVSETPDLIGKKFKDFVLILVLVEDGLGVLIQI